MISRSFWLNRIKGAWKKRPIVWLSGVRRVGKTTLARMIPEGLYMNCDLPSVCRSLVDPVPFFDALSPDSTVIFDEIHRLDDPSRVLKIAADEYPRVKILATGSSTLAATGKFRDSLTGRKHSIFLSPVLWNECLGTFNVKDLDHRLLHGGLPEPLLAKEKDPAFFAEWMDSFYARDIQELFALRNRSGFLKLLQLLLRQSGGQLDYTQLARLSDLSRPTVKAHIEAMCIAHAVCLLPPFSGGGRREITRMPRGYAFDTGFISYAKGWDSIREDDRGLLWEHLVIDSLRSLVNDRDLFYWRDKSRRDVDFVVRGRRKRVHAIECKVRPDRLNPDNLIAFRSFYPHGDNYVVSPFVKMPYVRSIRGLSVRFCSIDKLFS
ncbi:ATP-binding protein [Acidobacteriota bacterium]